MNKYSVHFGAKPHLFEKARELRKNQTLTEKILWKYLNDGQINKLKFRRQHPIDEYIVDFYCHKYKLVVEIDGKHHNIPENKEYDVARTNQLKELGIRVIRFTNKEVLSNRTKVLHTIQQEIIGIRKQISSPQGEDYGEVTSSQI
ncbi:endonuclease domain-containing protein [Bacteroidota bacterium]